jgi:DNA-binding SARP family transcriptional activator
MEGVKSLRVRLLGEFQIEGYAPSLLGRRQLRTLIKILALHHGHAVSTDRLVDYLWGEHPPAGAIDQISVLVSRLRSVVGPKRIQRSDAGYTLTVDWLDLDAVHAYAAEAEFRLARGEVRAARTVASAGLALLRGPLLVDEVDPWWAQAERSASELLSMRLRHASASAAVVARDWTSARALSSEMLKADPFDEEALRVLMEALFHSGRSASALAAYAEARERMADDLGTSPSQQTEELHSAILLGDLTVPQSCSDAVDAPVGALPGRDEVMRQLDASLEQVTQGHGAVVVIEGEAGIGKSRLLQVWSTHVARRGSLVVSVACDELGRALPLQPLLNVVSELLRHPATSDVSELLGPEASVIGPLLGVQTEATGAAQLAALIDPDAGQLLLVGALLGVFRRVAERQPLIVLIDDVHLADSATVRWLSLALHHLAENRVFIVAARRSEEGTPPPATSTISLGPLDLEAVIEIVGTKRAMDLHYRSKGNALFLVELAAVDAESELPSTIRHAVEERCARTGLPVAATLRAAAVIGPSIDLDLLAAVTDTLPSELLDHLEIGLQRGFLVEDGPRFAFAHALVREALAATVGASRTAYIHRAAARALGARRDPDPLAVARHARLGGEASTASSMLVLAATLAVGRFDLNEAIRLLDDAVSLHDSADARLERARVYSMQARYEAASDDIAVARTLGAGAELLEVAAWSAHLQRRFPDALVLADQGAQEATSVDLRTSCLALGGWVSLVSGDLIGASVRLDDALGPAPQASGGMAASWLAWLRVNQGRPAETLRLVKQQDGGGLASYRYPNAYALMAATMALGMMGMAEEALHTLDALQTDVERMGAQRWTPRPLNLRGWILRNLGELERADDLNSEAIEAAGERGMAEPLANALLDLVSGRLLAGDLEGADRFLIEAAPLADVEHAFRWRHQLRGRLLRTRLDLATGSTETALAAAVALADEAAALGTPRYEVQARLIAVLAARKTGAPTDMEEVNQLLSRLGRVAGLEAWWITAEVAKAFDVHRWTDLAHKRVAELRTHAGIHVDSLDHLARQRLG